MDTSEVHHIKHNSYRVSAKSGKLESSENVANIKAVVSDISKVVDELDATLGIKKLIGKSGRKSLILKRIDKVAQLYNQRDPSAAAIELSSLGLLAQQLKSLKDNHKAVFRKLAKEILKQSHQQSWVGIRAEVAVAALLWEILGDKFTKRERPDFEFEFNEELLSIEVTSAHLEKHKEGDLTYKIGSTVRSKNKKPYARKDVALFVDITNIFHHYFSDPSAREIDFISSINKLFSELEVKFGAVVIIVNRVNKLLNRYEMSHSALVMGDCCLELKEFMDAYFPEGTGALINPSFLSES